MAILFEIVVLNANITSVNTWCYCVQEVSVSYVTYAVTQWLESLREQRS